MLFVLTLSFFLYRQLIRFISEESVIHLKDGRIIRISSKSKIVFYGLLFLLCILPFELLLRSHEKQKFNQTAIYEVHPFLQNQLNIHDTHSHINSSGFRGENIQKHKPAEIFRVFVMGGSTVFGWGVPFEQSHVRILEKHLKQFYPNRKIEVLNAGASWHSSEHSVIKYLFKIKDFQPDLIILWHGINDLYRLFPSEKFSSVREFQADYSHFLGPMASMVFQHFERKNSL